MFIYLSSTNFDLKVLLPIVILLGLAAIIPVILAICRIKFIPVLVIEILTGILLASFSSKEFFVIIMNLHHLWKDFMPLEWESFYF